MSPIPRGGVLCNCWMDWERGGRVVVCFDSPTHTLSNTHIHTHIHFISIRNIDLFLFVVPLSWLCDSAPASVLQTPKSTLLFWDLGSDVAIGLLLHLHYLLYLFIFSIQTGCSAWHRALTFIHNTLLCFHERGEHSYHPICFESGSLRRLTVHTLLPRQTGGLSKYLKPVSPAAGKKDFFLFLLFCLPLVDSLVQKIQTMSQSCGAPWQLQRQHKLSRTHTTH